MVQIGNSGVRLPKSALELSGIKPGDKLDLEVRRGRLVLRRPGQAIHDDTVKQSYNDVKMVWDEALKDAWLEVFGMDE